MVCLSWGTASNHGSDAQYPVERHYAFSAPLFVGGCLLKKYLSCVMFDMFYTGLISCIIIRFCGWCNLVIRGFRTLSSLLPGVHWSAHFGRT